MEHHPCEGVWWAPCALAVFLLAGEPATGAGQPALSNGDAETGTTNPWTVDNVLAVQVIDQSTGAVHPYQGAWFFSLTEHPGGAGSLVQTNALPEAIAWLRLSGMVQTEYDDYGEAFLSVHDREGHPLAVATNGPLVTALFDWVPFEMGLPVPTNAASWRVELRGTLAFGSYVNVFYDAILLEGYESAPVWITNIWQSTSGEPVLAWTESDSGTVYTVEVTTSATETAFMPVAPTSQWPIVETTWTNSNTQHAIELYRIQGRHGP